MIKKRIICIASALSIFLACPLPVLAYDDGTGFDLELGESVVWDMPSFLLEEIPSDDFYATVEESMNVTGLDYQILYNGSVIGTGAWTFGQNVTANGHYLDLMMENDGNPLFNNGGTMYIMAFFNNAKLPCVIIERGNVTETLPLLTDSLSSDVAYNQTAYIEIPNSNADITGVTIRGSFDGSHHITVGATKYGYLLDVPVVPDTGGNSAEILSALNNFFGSYWNNFKASLASYWDGFVTNMVNYVNSIKTYTERISSQLVTNTSSFWNNIRTNITDYLTTINTSMQDYIAVFKDRMSLLYSQFTVSSSAFWNNFDTKLSDVLDRYWTSDNPTSDDVKTEIGNISSSENEIFDGGMSYVEDFDFEENSIDNLGESTIKGFTFVTGIMERLYANSGDYGTIVNITFTMLLASIGLGLKRFWSK